MKHTSPARLNMRENTKVKVDNNKFKLYLKENLLHKQTVKTNVFYKYTYSVLQQGWGNRYWGSNNIAIAPAQYYYWFSLAAWQYY